MSLEIVFWTLTGFAFLLGAVVGSFLNVVIYRVPAGLSVVKPASRCPQCGHAIRWYDNIPILSWALLLRGKCRDCGVKIPPRYALVEALTGFLTAMLWLKVAWRHFQSMEAFNQVEATTLVVPFGLYFIFICLLIAITFVDLDTFLIPHWFTFPGMALGVASAFILNNTSIMAPGSLVGFWPPVMPSMSIIGLLVGGGTVVAIYFLYFAVRGAEGIGGGDVTLMAMMGAWLGWPCLIFIFFAASFQGVIAAGISALLGGGIMKHSSEILTDEELAIAAGDGTTSKTSPPEGPAPEGPDEDAQESEDEDGEQDLPGGMAVPFGPFIALAGLEYFFLGPFLPPALSMSYLYGIW